MLLSLLLQAAAAPPQADPRRTPAQERPSVVAEPVAMLIASFDADGDGRTTRAELAAGVRRTFDAIDAGRTGKLGYLAFADWAERWLGDRTALPSPFEVDTDGDDQITEPELLAALTAAFNRFDKNGDGAVTRAELLTIRSAVSAPAGRGRHGRGRGGEGDPAP
jgi:hypothetical protein